MPSPGRGGRGQVPDAYRFGREHPGEPWRIAFSEQDVTPLRLLEADGVHRAAVARAEAACRRARAAVSQLAVLARSDRAAAQSRRVGVEGRVRRDEQPGIARSDARNRSAGAPVVWHEPAGRDRRAPSLRSNAAATRSPSCSAPLRIRVRRNWSASICCRPLRGGTVARSVCRITPAPSIRVSPRRRSGPAFSKST